MNARCNYRQWLRINDFSWHVADNKITKLYAIDKVGKFTLPRLSTGYSILVCCYCDNY